MVNKNLSVHLQNFPDISFIDDNQQLIKDMDLIRDICATILFIRDQRNLRVRLPLNEVTIFGYNSLPSLDNIKNNFSYQDLIKDEVNVKNIKIVTIAGQNKDVAEFKLQLNFKKIGAKLGQKMKEISFEAAKGNWQKISDTQIKINDIILENDDFEIKLIAKDQLSSAALPSNDCVVLLDINITRELEIEGIARDIIRSIQQNRKEADLDVSNHIEVVLCSSNQEIIEAVKIHEKNIKEQILAEEILLVADENLLKNYPHQFENKLEEIKLKIAFSTSNSKKKLQAGN